MSLHAIILRLKEERESGECPYDLDALLDEFGSWEAILDEVEAQEVDLSEEEGGDNGKVKITPCVRNVLRKWKVSASSPNPKKFKSRFARNRGGERKSAGKWYKTAGQAAAAVCAWIGSRKAGAPGAKGVMNNPKQTARKSSVDDPGSNLSETKPMPGRPSGKYYGYAAPFAGQNHPHWDESGKRKGPTASSHKGREKRKTGKGLTAPSRKKLARKRKGPPPRSGKRPRGFKKEPLS